VGVEKVRQQKVFSAALMLLPSFGFLSSLSGGWQGGCCGLAEEVREPLEVLCSRCQKELLPHDLQSSQA
jgi:hypothetical protein